MTTPGDGDVRRLITRDGLTRTLFVQAGAGTGKTTELVERITNLVVEEGVGLANIAAITFTEAAAAELVDRIRVAFERRLVEADARPSAGMVAEAATLTGAAPASPGGDRAATGSSDPAAVALVKERCLQAITDADRAAISTLHGFARRILAAHPLAVGLPPRVGILDEVSSELAYEARWERFVDGLYADPAHEALLIRAMLVGAELEPRYPNHATMKDVAAELAQSWDRIDAVADRVHGPLPPVDFGPFDRAAAAIEALGDDCLDDSDRLYCKIVDDILPALRAVTVLTDPDRKLRALANWEPWRVGNLGRQGAWRAGAPAARGVVGDLNAAVRAVVDRVTDDVLARLLTLVAREVRNAAEARRAEGNLEFHDLLVLARRLLRTSPEARGDLHQRYTHLLLDEFQDTDPIQIELAVLLAAGIEGVDVPGWTGVPVADGRLFFVGDPKQSIYRFRRADIELFLTARDRYGPDGSWLRLVTNFRTVRPVLEWINHLFGKLMADEVPGRQPAYEALVADREATGSGGDHRPVLLGGPHPRAKAAELREAEAADVAAAIERIRRVPQEWPVYDRAERHWRAARLADITILVPARTSLPQLRSALSASDIPYRLNTGTLVYDTQEVRDALSAVRAVDDATDELALVAALRSPLYACADTDLFTWRRAGGRFDLRSAPPDGIAGDHPVAAACEHLRSLWEQRWWLRPSALLDRLLEDRRAFLLAFAGGRAPEVWGRLRFLLDQARAFEEAAGGGLREFVAWADLQRSERARVHEPLLPETDDDAVRIMTIHGAKGLEFPITIVSGLTTRPRGGNRSGVRVVWNDDGTPEVKLGGGVATANYDPRADIEAEMDRHEKLRLLYVACTRARDHLIVAGHHQAGDGSYASTVWDLLQDEPDRWRRVSGERAVTAGAETGVATGASAPAETAGSRPARPGRVGSGRPPLATPLALPFPLAVPLDDREAWLGAREALLAPQRRSRVTSATAIAQEATGIDLADEDGTAAGAGDADLDFAAAAGAGAGSAGESGVVGGPGDSEATGRLAAAPPVAPRRRGRAGTAIGRAVHATLQFLDLGGQAGIDEQASRQADLEAIPELAATVAAMARSALAAEAVQTAAKLVHHKECYVAAPVGERVVEGYIDLLVETDDGLVIVDYKTDTAASEAEIDGKLAAYELQGGAYAVALEESTGLPVVDCRFVFCRPGGAVERRVADLAGAKERVRRHLRS